MPSTDLEDPEFDEQNRAWFAGAALMDPESTAVHISRNVKAVTVTIG